MDDINLAEYGLEYLFPYQRLVISNILANEEAAGDDEADARPYQIVILPTAAGKSLCFQLPAPKLKGITIVIYPLLGLISDQSRRLETLKITHRVLTGASSREEKMAFLQEAAERKVRVLLTNPETILLPYIMQRLKEITCSHLVIDEAHCITEWGKSFRPRYRELGALQREVAFTSISAFTATASEPIIKDISATLFNGAPVHLIQGNPDRENIHYTVRPTLSVENSIIDLITQSAALSSRPPHVDGNNALPPLMGLQPPMIIFCATRGATERYARLMRHYTGNNDIFFYHAGLSAAEKAQTEEWFFKSERGFLFATCAYGMGMDKANIRSVVHTFIPATIESYLQESGRGGRDKEEARALLYYSPLTIAEALRCNPASPLLSYCTDSAHCRRAGLLRTLGVENVLCSGCDVCDGTASTITAREQSILRYLRRHQRMLSLPRLMHLLARARGKLWESHYDAERYLEHLKHERFLAVSSRGMWKNSYRISRVVSRNMRGMGFG